MQALSSSADAVFPGGACAWDGWIPGLAWTQVEPSPLLSAGAVRASSVFPILSVTLLFFGGLCVAASEFHRSRHNVILSAGIFFVSAGELPAPAPRSSQAPTPSQAHKDRAVLFRVPSRARARKYSAHVKNEKPGAPKWLSQLSLRV